MIWMLTKRLLLQSPEVGNQILNIGIFELFSEGGHFAFDASFYDGCNSGIALVQVVEARSFVPAGVIAVAVRAVAIKQVVPRLCFLADGGTGLGWTRWGLRRSLRNYRIG